MFQLAVREDALGVTVSYKGKTVVLTLDQALASVSGRLVALPAPPVRGPAPGRRWLVPAEFISRALALVYDAKLDLRKPSRLADRRRSCACRACRCATKPPAPARG